MAFVEPITIKEAIDNVYRKNYVLPAIQREFVWSTSQIERLFDSLMRDYPISSFLFWDIERSNVNDYQFYEFVRDFHERDNRHNPKANLNGNSGITAILDGQQRLTSLYIGLKGTYAYKIPYKRWDNDSAFPKRKLFLNLIASSSHQDLEYDFQFLTKKESENINENHFYFSVGDILNFKEAVDVNDYLIEKDLQSFGKEKFRLANKTLFKLYEVIHKNKSINFFLEKDESLDKVLNIFIRVNSGGTKLSYSDLLLSIATAQWKDKDAREEITSFVDEINNIGDGFNFNKDFVLKSSLVISDLKDIAFKVDNFNQKNMYHIEKNWENVSNAISGAIYLISSFGYHRETLTSNNAIIPIAYYLQKIGSPSNFALAEKYKIERNKIFKWLTISLLKRTFGGHPDNVLKLIREVISSSKHEFPYTEILDKLKTTPKAMNFDENEIENLMFYQYGHSYTYSMLAFIYPTLDFRNKFHQDHIFPQKLFKAKTLKKMGVKDSDIEFCLNNFNYLGNLQLLEGIPNQEKSGQDFQTWLFEKFPKKSDRENYMEMHYIPTNIDLTISNFPAFIAEREKLLSKAFVSLLRP